MYVVHHNEYVGTGTGGWTIKDQLVQQMTAAKKIESYSGSVFNSFDALGEPIGDRLDSRRFATLSIDAARCNSCGMCAVFCPTGALSRDSVEKISDPLNYLEFSTAECVNCRLCEDVCWKGALTLEEGVAIEQLYDFEPVRFDVPKQGARAKFGAF